MKFITRMKKRNRLIKISVVPVVCLIMLSSISNVYAVPGGLDKQIPVTGRLVDLNGAIVDDGAYRMKLSLYDSATGGAQLFEELFDGATDYGSGVCAEIAVKNGSFRADMGSCNPISTAAYQSLFNNTELHLEIALDINEDGAFEEVFDPRRKLTLAMGAVSALQLVSNGTGTSSNTLGIDNQGHLQLNGVGRFGVNISGSIPQSTLEVNDGGITARAHLYGVGDGSNYSEFRLGRDTQGSESWNLYHRQVGGENGNFVIEEFDGSNNNQRFVINPGGNIGIGTTNADARFSIEANAGGVFDALRISNIAVDGQSQISFEESSQGQNFSIRYRGDQDQLEFVGLGGNETFQIDAADGDVFTQDDIDVGVDLDISGDLIVNGNISKSVGDVDIISNGNNDIDLQPGAGGDVNFNLSDNGGANDNCLQVTNDGTGRIIYNCIEDELQFVNNGEFSINAPAVFNQWISWATTETNSCPDVGGLGIVPGMWFSDIGDCETSFLGAANIIDSEEVIGWGVSAYNFLVNRQGAARSESVFDTTNTTYQVTQAGQSRFNNLVTTGGLYPGGTDYSVWLDVAGNMRSTGNQIINNPTAVISNQDTDHRSAFTYVNDSYFYVLRGCGVNANTWCQTGAYWPMYIHLETNNAVLGGDVFVAGVLSKTSGTFDIKHPNPALQAAGWRLRHSFVESPTRGDNIYRFEASVKNGIATLELPDYYKYLNEDSQVWISPIDNYGSGTGVVDENLEKIDIQADQDGAYSVLVIGTRKDEDAQIFDEKGVEYQGEVSSAPPVSP
jgi:hypothetical protein